MKKLMVVLSTILSLSATAGTISCSGSGVNLKIDTSQSKLTISGTYNGSVDRLTDSGVEFFGRASSGNFRSLSLFVDGPDSELTIIDSRGRSSGVMGVNCR